MFSLGDKIGISFKNDKGELAAAILTVTKITTPKEAVIEGTVEQSVADKEFDEIPQHPDAISAPVDRPANTQELADLEYCLRQLNIWSDDREQRAQFVAPWISKCFAPTSITAASMIQSMELTNQFINYLKEIIKKNAQIN